MREAYKTARESVGLPGFGKRAWKNCISVSQYPVFSVGELLRSLNVFCKGLSSVSVGIYVAVNRFPLPGFMPAV
jgi:hypothetical protein